MENIVNKLNEAFHPNNEHCDGAACTGCWKDVIREAIRMIENQSPEFVEFFKETEQYLNDTINDFEDQAQRHPSVATVKLANAEKYRRILSEFKLRCII